MSVWHMGNLCEYLFVVSVDLRFQRRAAALVDRARERGWLTTPQLLKLHDNRSTALSAKRARMASQSSSNWRPFDGVVVPPLLIVRPPADLPLQRKNMHPRDDRITFDEKLHVYTLDSHIASVVCLLSLLGCMLKGFV